LLIVIAFIQVVGPSHLVYKILCMNQRDMAKQNK
jgi:hypothetical protein